MTWITDALGQRIDCSQPPQRVVSLVPSITETLYDIGAWESVVGVTRYCVHPELATSEKSVVGGTKQVNMEAIQTLKPDLVLCNKEENTPEIIEALEKMGIPYHVSFPTDIASAITAVQDLGRLFQCEQWVEQWTRQVHEMLRREHTPFQYAYFIWRKPWMLAGHDTFINEMLETIGGINIADTDSRYPEVCPSADTLGDADVLLLSSEPFPFKDKHIDELVLSGVNRQKILYIDGEMCSWHGTRLKQGLHYLKEWHHQIIQPASV